LTPVGYHELLEDLRHRGCPVCRGVARHAARYVEGLLYESVNDPYLRPRLRAAHGFCRDHALLALQIAGRTDGGQGIAILYRDFLGHLRLEAEEAVRGGSASLRRRRRAVLDRLRPHASCSACGTAAGTVHAYLVLLSGELASSEIGLAARAPGRGLCIPHLEDGLTIARSEEERLRLLDIYTRADDELRSQLSEYLRKRDYRFQAEGLTEDEAVSWRRAVHRVVGGW
jgi:Family of unknown function (DUF6062)